MHLYALLNTITMPATDGSTPNTPSVRLNFLGLHPDIAIGYQWWPTLVGPLPSLGLRTPSTDGP